MQVFPKHIHNAPRRRKNTLWNGVVLIGALILLGLLLYEALGHGFNTDVIATNIPTTSPSAIVATSSTSTAPISVSTPSEGQTLAPLSTGSGQTPPTDSSPPTPTYPPNPPIAPKPTPVLNYSLGLSAGQTLLGLSTTELNTRLDDMASLGIGWIRFDMDWSDVQPDNSTTYNWKSIDRLVAATNARHIKLLVILDYTPAWARAAECADTWRCRPADPAQFAVFASTAVQRYASQGLHHWEIWNEPNMKGSWHPYASTASYVALIKAVYPAIKSADHSATVMVGSMGPAATRNGDIAPLEFLQQIYDEGGKGYFDAVSFHPYTFPVSPVYVAVWNSWRQMADTSPSLRSIMIAHGDGDKKIWPTEYGAPTGGPGDINDINHLDFTHGADYMTESAQRQMLEDAVALHAKETNWIGPLFWYSYKDLGTSNNTQENFFGLLRNDGTHKPAYDVYKALIHAGGGQ